MGRARYYHCLAGFLLWIITFTSGCSDVDDDPLSSNNNPQTSSADTLLPSDIRMHEGIHEHEHVDDITIGNVSLSQPIVNPDQGETITFSFDLNHAPRYSTSPQYWEFRVYIYGPEGTSQPYDFLYTSYTGNNQRYQFVFDGKTGFYEPVAGGLLVYDGSTSETDERVALPPGQYTAELYAYCGRRTPLESGVHRYYSNVEQRTFSVGGQAPETELIQFPTALPFNNDDGEPIGNPDILYKAPDEAVAEISHPVVIPLVPLDLPPIPPLPSPPSIPSTGSRSSSTLPPLSVPVTMRWTFEEPLEYGTEYIWRFRDSEGQELMLPKRESLLAGTKTVVLTANLEIPREVQKMEFLKLDFKILDVHEDWITETRLPEEPLYVSLGAYTQPFNDTDRPTEGLLDIAYHLARGARDANEARDKIIENLPQFFADKNFIYDLNQPFITLAPLDHDDYASYVNFEYTRFMRGYNSPDFEWEGGCEAISSFTVCCAAAVGADTRVKRFTGDFFFEPFTNQYYHFTFKTHSAKPNAPSYIDPDLIPQPSLFKEWEFNTHQVCASYAQIWCTAGIKR